MKGFNILFILVVFLIACNSDTEKVAQQQKVIQELQDSINTSKARENYVQNQQNSKTYVFTRINYSYSEYNTKEIYLIGESMPLTVVIKDTIYRSYFSSVREFYNYSKETGDRLLDKEEQELREYDAEKYRLKSIGYRDPKPRDFKITDRNAYIFSSYSEASKSLFNLKVNN